MDIQVRNIKYGAADQSKVELEALLPWLPGEWIPLHLTANYNQDYGKALFAEVIAGTHGAIGPYVAPPFIRTVPQSVTRFQALAALYQAGLLAGIETYMQDPTTDGFTKLAWKEVLEFRRQSPLVTSIGTLFGLTDAQVDDLFVFAATIEA